MAAVDFSSRHPEIDPDTFVAEGARLIGRVILKSEASVRSGQGDRLPQTIGH